MYRAQKPESESPNMEPGIRIFFASRLARTWYKNYMLYL